MPAAPGRLFVIRRAGTAIAGVRDVSMTVNGETIDVTDQSDTSFATLLDGEIIDRSLELSVSGVEKDGVLQGIALGSSSGYFMTDITIDLPTTGNTVSGNFVFGNYQETGPYKDAVTFSCTFRSDGAWAIAPTV